MAVGPFSLWVQSGVPEPLARQIVRQLAIAFNVQITPAQLREGACLFSAATQPLVEARADEARSAGASFQIVDAQGTVVSQGAGRRAPASGSTLLGLAPFGDSAPAAPSAAQERGDGFDNIDDSSLMTLDGESDARAAGHSGRVRRPRSAALPAPRTASAAAHSAAPLELERPKAQQRDSFAPQDEDLQLELSVPRARAPQPAALPPAPRPSSPVAAPQRAPDPYASSAPLPAPSRAPLRRSAQRAVERPGALLFGGQLRQSPRLRVMVGFLLALGLGSILPAWRASVVMSTRVEPARQQLARATAYGHLLAGQRGYSSPEEIMAYIAGVKRRGATYGVLMWLGCGALGGFLWFRFT